MIKIAPSVLSADLGALVKDIEKVENTADWLHWDIMDGHFVDNLTFGPQFVSNIRKKSKLFFDVHLMIANPDRFIPKFIEAGADLITFHAEVVDNLRPNIQTIKASGIKVGVAINPPTPLDKIYSVLEEIDVVLIMTVNPGFSGQGFIYEVLPKIEELSKIITQRNLKLELEVDGGINLDTAYEVVKRGATALVAGSFVYQNQQGPKEAIRSLRKRTKKIDNS
ncbi:MAG: ribulose-phosphate 3-epimerase [bacterium]|nr:ribulose-phosphate 3-epimerase [bacterium]